MVKDVVIVGLQAIDTPIGSNCVNIAYELTRIGHRVLYVNYPFDSRTFFKQLLRPNQQTRIRMDVLRRRKKELHEVEPNLYAVNLRLINLSIGFLPDGRLFDLLNHRNNKRAAHRIKKHLSELGMKEYMLFNDSDMVRSFYLKELLNPVCSIYYSRDNLISQPYFARHGKRLEAQLIATSKQLKYEGSSMGFFGPVNKTFSNSWSVLFLNSWSSGPTKTNCHSGCFRASCSNSLMSSLSFKRAPI